MGQSGDSGTMSMMRNQTQTQPMDAGGNANDWRTALANESRTRLVKRIMETLQRHMPVTGQEGMNELYNIALRFEQKIFQAASDQQDYLRKISLKMLSLETRAQNPADSGMSGGYASEWIFK
eukprot:TRINITY_DN6778_c0_g1_i1.p1 TRINITY_DN6778_c0_g1~~TRINITY_DN6778_c0_g1_i1.p1  ORF type:complete len:132 (+),score=21.88 TRINITY_DN6778_c0_g1_i1:31-396(+)